MFLCYCVLDPLCVTGPFKFYINPIPVAECWFSSLLLKCIKTLQKLQVLPLHFLLPPWISIPSIPWVGHRNEILFASPSRCRAKPQKQLLAAFFPPTPLKPHIKRTAPLPLSPMIVRALVGKANFSFFCPLSVSGSALISLHGPVVFCTLIVQHYFST